MKTLQVYLLIVFDGNIQLHVGVFPSRKTASDHAKAFFKSFETAIEKIDFYCPIETYIPPINSGE